METYEKFVKEAMDEVVKNHKWNHPLYQESRIDKSIIDSKNKRATFVLFEQIDTDRLSPEGEGWLGDQFRYSLWLMEQGKKPKQLYEDHAYIRPRTISQLTGTRGRDCKIHLDELIDNGIIIDISTEEWKRKNDEYLRKKVLLDFNGKINSIPKKSKLKTYWLK